MPNYGYHLARAEGKTVRTIYRMLLPAVARSRIATDTEVPINVVSYCGEKSLPEQIASIRSFLKHIGRPRQFTVVSDGTLSNGSCDILKSLASVIAISDSGEWVPRNLPAEIYPYLTNHPTGKQLALIMSLPLDDPTLYIDSDILFFAGAKNLHRLLENHVAPAYYLADCRLSADERLFRSDVEKAGPVNTGALLLFERLDWALAIDRFIEIKGSPDFFTNQTMTHLTMHANAALPFDHRMYVLQLDDQFEYLDRYASRDLVLRHYVTPVRHKFWKTLARWTH